MRASTVIKLSKLPTKILSSLNIEVLKYVFIHTNENIGYLPGYRLPTRIAEEWCLLGCYAVWLLEEPTFRRNLAPPSSG
jgi:hypothetical protein